MGDILVAGCNSDEDLLLTKGPTIMNINERAEILRHCKWIDEIELDTPYCPTKETLERYNCAYYAHGDDLAIDATGHEITQWFRDNGRFKIFKRTEGVSTTDLTGRLLAVADYLMKKKLVKD